MYKLYFYNIKNLTDNQYSEWYDQMDKTKKRRVDRLKLSDSKKRTVVGDALARRAIYESCGIDKSKIKFYYSEKGKPFVRDVDLFFNISHSYDIVICGISDENIGVDIEKIRPITRKLAEKVCKDDELYGIMDSNGQINCDEFFKVWTGKEAYFKFKGTGITDFKSIGVSQIKNIFYDNIEYGYLACVITGDKI